MAAVLRIFTAGATREGLALCAGPFEAETGIRIDSRTTHGHLIEARVIAGEADDDMVLLPAATIGNLAARGLIRSDFRQALGAIRIGAAVRDGAPLPDVSTMDALKRTLLDARSVVLTLAPSGRHVERVIEAFGLSGTLAPRIVRYDMGYMVNDHLIASGAEDEVAFGVATEISIYRDRGVRYAGPLPDEAQMALDYEAAMLSRSEKVAAVRRLLDYFATGAAREAFARAGVDVRL
jgi:molybdate transport system substrate-binding protein